MIKMNIEMRVRTDQQKQAYNDFRRVFNSDDFHLFAEYYTKWCITKNLLNDLNYSE